MRSLSVHLACPARLGSRTGNRVTALRWSGHLRALGHRVRITGPDTAADPDLLIALHAIKSEGAIRAFTERHPDRPLIIALTGTDLYGAMVEQRGRALAVLRLARALIGLHPAVAAALPQDLRDRVHVVPQSTRALSRRRSPDPDSFELAFIGHLRPVKDPLTLLDALRQLPPVSRIRATIIGSLIDAPFEDQFTRALAATPRARWLGSLPRGETLFHLSGCQGLVSTSLMEGGANVISEALVNDVPVIASKIPGSVGLLGTDFPSLFPPGDATALLEQILRLERDPDHRRDLRQRGRDLSLPFAPERERTALCELLLATTTGENGQRLEK